VDCNPAIFSRILGSLLTARFLASLRALLSRLNPPFARSSADETSVARGLFHPLQQQYKAPLAARYLCIPRSARQEEHALLLQNTKVVMGSQDSLKEEGPTDSRQQAWRGQEVSVAPGGPLLPSPPDLRVIHRKCFQGQRPRRAR
jgi:hypothetical protein